MTCPTRSLHTLVIIIYLQTLEEVEVHMCITLDHVNYCSLFSQTARSHEDTVAFLNKQSIIRATWKSLWETYLDRKAPTKKKDLITGLFEYWTEQKCPKVEPTIVIVVLLSLLLLFVVTFCFFVVALVVILVVHYL